MFEQDRVIVRLQQRVLREKAIVLCILTGSFGRGTQDLYSDIDVVLVYSDERNREEAFSARREFVQSVLPYVPAKSYDAGHLGATAHVALYSNGAKVDYHFETVANLEKNDINPSVRLLKDTLGWSERLQSVKAGPPLPMKTPVINNNMLARLDERFWVMYIEVYRLLLRGETDKTYPIYLEMLYLTFPALLTFLPPGAIRTKLTGAFFDLDSRATLDHLRQLLPAYIEARSAIVKRFDLPYISQDSFEREIIRLVQRT